MFSWRSDHQRPRLWILALVAMVCTATVSVGAQVSNQDRYNQLQCLAINSIGALHTMFEYWRSDISSSTANLGLSSLQVESVTNTLIDGIAYLEDANGTLADLSACPYNPATEVPVVALLRTALNNAKPKLLANHLPLLKSAIPALLKFPDVRDWALNDWDNGAIDRLLLKTFGDAFVGPIQKAALATITGQIVADAYLSKTPKQDAKAFNTVTSFRSQTSSKIVVDDWNDVVLLDTLLDTIDGLTDPKYNYNRLDATTLTKDLIQVMHAVVQSSTISSVDATNAGSLGKTLEITYSDATNIQPFLRSIDQVLFTAENVLGLTAPPPPSPPPPSPPPPSPPPPSPGSSSANWPLSIWRLATTFALSAGMAWLWGASR
ncbi:hypothetical protein VaNZ11_007225 [Volvox africanus]|uniref:Uncharacterized protein n=1 Tax=Volvox africanus TaxID=51714 RepID=A0ABQ5S2G4_9CHLO|nr:hypothetical protein VaNZ11_007225 [Volvox africanus]